MTEWRTADIPDLTDRVAIVTGANSGIGYETTKELVRSGATVVMACRSKDRGASARDKLLATLGTKGGAGARRSESRRSEVDAEPVLADRIVVQELDLTKPESIEAFVKRFSRDHPDQSRLGVLDLLVNNAGIMACPPALTEQGVERQWASNHLGHFALTGLLLPTLVDGGRVVSVSSLAAAGGDLSGPIPTTLDHYSRFQVYSDTKLANQVFAVELNHRLAAAGRTAISVVAHPGLSHTNLGASLDIPLLSTVLTGLSRFLTQSAADGALPTLRAAADPAVEGGQYYGPSGRNQHRGPPKQIALVNGASRRSLGRQLWHESMALTGVRYLAGD